MVNPQLLLTTTMSPQEPLLERPGANGNGSSHSRPNGESTLDKLRKQLAAPTLRNLLICSVLFGTVVGCLAYVYENALEFCLWLVWDQIPESIVKPTLEQLRDSKGYAESFLDNVSWVYIPIATVVFGCLAGVVQALLGFPGDLPDTVRCLHAHGFIPIRQVPSMFLCSIFSIVAGGSLGPEAPIVALSAGVVSFISRSILHHKGRMLRYCTLMGMGAALAAFFGVGIGGSFFALEVVHRFGIQYHEPAVFTVLCGCVCIVVYRSLLLEDLDPIWPYEWPEGQSALSWHVVFGAVLGAVSGAFGMLFMLQHRVVGWAYSLIRVSAHQNPVVAGTVGGLLVGLLGVFVPTSMFWSEWEIVTLVDPQEPLAHLWPQGGFYGLAPFRQGDYSWWVYLVSALAKLPAISITMLSGFRGGFIFPLMFAGTSLGLCMHSLVLLWNIPFLKDIPKVVYGLCCAGGINVAITRTPFASALILTALAGSMESMSPVAVACIVSLYVTGSWPFIKPQQDRKDILFIDEEDVKEYLGDESFRLHQTTATMNLHATRASMEIATRDFQQPHIQVADGVVGGGYKYMEINDSADASGHSHRSAGLPMGMSPPQEVQEQMVNLLRRSLRPEGSVTPRDDMFEGGSSV